MKYRSTKLSVRDRVAQNRMLAGLVSAAIVDIWRNVVGLSPDWDETTILPNKFSVGASSQVLVFSMDCVNYMIQNSRYSTAGELAEGLRQTIELCECSLSDPRRVNQLFIGQQLSDEIMKEPVWQQFRAPLISSTKKDAEFIEYLPIAFSALALDSNWARARQVLFFLAQYFKIEVNYQDFKQTWMAFNRKADLTLDYQNLEEVILDFKISPSEAVVAGLRYGLRDGLQTFYNSWPSRMDAFTSFELISDRLAKNLKCN